MGNWDKRTVSAILSIVLTALVALLAAFGYDVQVVQPRVAEQIEAVSSGPLVMESRGVTGFDDLAVASVSATGAVSAGSVSAAGAVAAGGNLSAGGKLLQASTPVTLTAGMTITPATSLYVLSATGSVSMTLAAPAAPGQVLYLYGDDNQTITVNDTNILSTDGNAVTLGQYDIVEFFSVGSKWVHVAKSADS